MQRGPTSISPLTQPDSDPDHFLSTIANIARNNDIDIISGTVVELGKHHVPHRTQDREGLEDDHHDKLFNTAYYIDRTGRIAGRYTKEVRRSYMVDFACTYTLT